MITQNITEVLHLQDLRILTLVSLKFYKTAVFKKKVSFLDENQSSLLSCFWGA